MDNTANIDWTSLGFGYVPTDYNVRVSYKDGKWGEIEVTKSDSINIHMAATCLHYGQEIFEGLKAFRGKDGKIRIFRLEENAKRIRRSAEGIMMEPLPVELFKEMVIKVVKLNERFIPPYGSGASLYIRPIELGMTAQVGVKPATEYLFMIFVTPVGAYFKEGFRPAKIAIYRGYDRAAPLGTGRWKVGGNYAASLAAGQKAKEGGYAAVLYLDPKEQKYIDECGPANFFAVRDNTYITPKSDSILPSITNMSLQQIALDMGLKVEARPVPVEELATVEEAAECGTAAVAAPILQVDDIDTGVKYVISKNGEPGPVTTELYNRLRGIQLGDLEDTHNWVTVLD